MALADIPVALVEACKRNDRPSIDRLLQLIGPDIYRIAYSMLRDPDDTDEIVQETLVRIFRHIGGLKEPDRFAAWAMRITVNQVQTWRVKKGRRLLNEVADGNESEAGIVVLAGRNGDTPRDQAIRGEVRLEIEQAMSELPARQQTAIVLFEIEGCSIKEISAAMGCSEGAVKFNIHEARKKLKRRLGHLVKGLGFGTHDASVDPMPLSNGEHS